MLRTCSFCGTQLPNNDAYLEHLNQSTQCRDQLDSNLDRLSQQVNILRQREMDLSVQNPHRENPPKKVRVHPSGTDVQAETDHYRCPVCYENLGRIKSIKCGHLLCIKCSKKVYTSTKNCPTCRKPWKKLTLLYP